MEKKKRFILLAPLVVQITTAGVVVQSQGWQVPNDVKEIIAVRLDSNFPERFVYGASIEKFEISGKQVVPQGVLAKNFHNTQHGKNNVSDKFFPIAELDKDGLGFLNGSNTVVMAIVDNENPLYAGAVFAPYTVKLSLYCELKEL